MDDGLIWERERWIGNWCWSVCRLESDFGLGFQVALDDHPQSGNRFGFMIGPIWFGVWVSNEA